MLYIVLTRTKALHNEFMRKCDKYCPEAKLVKKFDADKCPPGACYLLSKHISTLKEARSFHKRATKRGFTLVVITYGDEKERLDISDKTLAEYKMKVASHKWID